MVIELNGSGLALGVEENHEYEENIYPDLTTGTIILIGTDGVWDTENLLKQRFGKKKVSRALQQAKTMSS